MILYILVGFIMTTFLYSSMDYINMGIQNIKRVNNYRVMMNLGLFECMRMLFGLFHSFVISFVKTKFQVYLKGWFLTKVSNNEYELEVVVANKLIKMIIVVNRGPSPILQIIDENNNDVTGDYKQYLSYKYNYKVVTSDLSIIKSNGDELTITKGNELKIDL